MGGFALLPTLALSPHPVEGILRYATRITDVVMLRFEVLFFKCTALMLPHLCCPFFWYHTLSVGLLTGRCQWVEADNTGPMNSYYPVGAGALCLELYMLNLRRLKHIDPLKPTGPTNEPVQGCSRPRAKETPSEAAERRGLAVSSLQALALDYDVGDHDILKESILLEVTFFLRPGSVRFVGCQPRSIYWCGVVRDVCMLVARGARAATKGCHGTPQCSLISRSCLLSVQRAIAR